MHVPTVYRLNVQTCKFQALGCKVGNDGYQDTCAACCIAAEQLADPSWHQLAGSYSHDTNTNKSKLTT